MKRLFAVLIFIMLLFVTGCQGVSVVDANVDESGQLILYMSDGSSINAGMVKGADGKDGKDGKDGADGLNGRDGADGADGVGIAKAAVNDSGDLMIRLTDDTLINAGEVKGKDGIDGRDGQDGRDGINGKNGKDGADGKDGVDGKDAPAPLTEPIAGSNAAPVLLNDPGMFEGEDSEAPDTIIIPEGTTEIKPEEFMGNTSVCVVSIPASVTTISADAFKGCTNLKSVIFEPDSKLTKIENGAFEGCSGLSEFIFPKSLGSIGKSAFKNSGLNESICFYNGITIMESAFEGTHMREIIFNPANTAELSTESNAFANCSDLEKLTLPTDLAALNLAKDTFSNCNDMYIGITKASLQKKYRSKYPSDYLGLAEGKSVDFGNP